jgi:hypothetical protein
MGMGDKLFAVPWAALALDTVNKRSTLNVPKDDLKDAPGFDKDHWPSMSDKTWASGVPRFYGTQYTAEWAFASRYACAGLSASKQGETMNKDQVKGTSTSQTIHQPSGSMFDLITSLVVLMNQHVAKAQRANLIRNAFATQETNKVAVQRGLEKNLFHGQVR